MSNVLDSAALVTKYRERKGFTKTALAEMVGRSLTWVLMIEQGERKVTMEILPVLIEKLGLSETEADEFRDAVRYDRTPEEGRELIKKAQTEGSEGGIKGSKEGQGATPRDYVLVPVIPRNFDGDVLEVVMTSGKHGYAQGYVEPPVSVESQVTEQFGPLVAFFVEGDDMAPRLAHGSRVYGAVEHEPVSGKFALVAIDGEVMCRIWRANGESITLEPVNPEYKARTCKMSEISWAYLVIGSYRPEV